MQAGKYTLDFSRTLIMGVLNVTPDSFSDGGKFMEVEKAVRQAQQMVAEGADIIDIGGESSRPGSEPVSEEEELRRVLPVVERLVKMVSVPLSIDSYKPRVVEECLKRGVSLVNDISGLRNPVMVDVVARYDVPVIIMHMLGSPKTMQQEIKYIDVIQEINDFFKAQIQLAEKKGVRKMMLDPGIGFGKTVEHNLLLLKYLAKFKQWNFPLVVGTSRKSFIGKISNVDVSERLPGTIASNVLAMLHGANILRVHDVKECKQAIEIVEVVMRVGG